MPEHDGLAEGAAEPDSSDRTAYCPLGDSTRGLLCVRAECAWYLRRPAEAGRPPLEGCAVAILAASLPLLQSLFWPF